MTDAQLGIIILGFIVGTALFFFGSCLGDK